MNKLAIAILSLLIAIPATAKNWFIKWDKVNEATGYTVSYTTGEDSYQKDVGNVTQVNLNDLQIGVGIDYTYTITAYNEYTTSPPSEQVQFTRPLFNAGEDNNLPQITITIPNGVSNITILREGE